MEKCCILLFNVAPVDCNARVSKFSMRHHYSGIACLLKTPSLVQTNDNQMEPSLDYIVDEAGDPTSAAVQLPSLKWQCEHRHCLGGGKLNPAFYFALSRLPASIFLSRELNNNAH